MVPCEEQAAGGGGSWADGRGGASSSQWWEEACGQRLNEDKDKLHQCLGTETSGRENSRPGGNKLGVLHIPREGPPRPNRRSAEKGQR